MSRAKIFVVLLLLICGCVKEKPFIVSDAYVTFADGSIDTVRGVAYFFHETWGQNHFILCDSTHRAVGRYFSEGVANPVISIKKSGAAQ